MSMMNCLICGAPIQRTGNDHIHNSSGQLVDQPTPTPDQIAAGVPAVLEFIPTPEGEEVEFVPENTNQDLTVEEAQLTVAERKQAFDDFIAKRDADAAAAAEAAATPPDSPAEPAEPIEPPTTTDPVPATPPAEPLPTADPVPTDGIVTPPPVVDVPTSPVSTPVPPPPTTATITPPAS